MNKNYVQINQYLGEKNQGNHNKETKKKYGSTKEGTMSQTSQGGVHIHGDTKERQDKYIYGSLWMGKRKKPEETAEIKSQVHESL